MIYGFQTLIGILQTQYNNIILPGEKKFQTLIGILQTHCLLASPQDSIRFQTLIGILQTKTRTLLLMLLAP